MEAKSNKSNHPPKITSTKQVVMKKFIEWRKSSAIDINEDLSNNDWLSTESIIQKYILNFK